MYSNTEFRDIMKKVRPDYVLRSSKGNDKWKESRNFVTIIYPESLNDDIISGCDCLGVPCALSPLHDKDINDSGELKKAHYHLVAKYNSKKNPYQFYCDLVGAFGENAFSTLEIVSDLGAMVRYLVHLDSIDEKKYKYDINDIKVFNGFEHKKYLYENVGDTMENVEKLMDLIEEKNFLFFDELSQYLRYEEPLLFSGLIKDREVKVWVRDYLRGREHSLWYSGAVEKGYTRIHMSNDTEKVIFNRQIKDVSVSAV